jgi:hypothetical protein
MPPRAAALLTGAPHSRSSACPPAHLPTCPPAHLPTCPPAHLPTCPPARLPACPPARHHSPPPTPNLPGHEARPPPGPAPSPPSHCTPAGSGPTRSTPARGAGSESFPPEQPTDPRCGPGGVVLPTRPGGADHSAGSGASWLPIGGWCGSSAPMRHPRSVVLPSRRPVSLD